VRVKATASAFKSEEISITISAFGATQETTPNATIDYISEKLTGLTADANYTVNTIAKQADASGTIAIESDWFGTTVSIVKTGNGSTTIDSTAQSRAIPTRPAAPGVTAIQPTVIGGTGGISGTTTAMEYKLSTASSWTAITGSSVTGLTAGSYVVRVKATASAFKSEEISVTISAFGATQETTPNAAIDYISEKLTGLTLNANYTVNTIAKQADASGTIAIESNWFGTTVSIVKTGNGSTTIDSTAQSRAIPSRPAISGVTAIQPTVIGGTGGISGTNNGMEYKPAAGSWTAITGSAVTGLTTGSYSVRVKATSSAFASVEVSVTVNTFAGTSEATPAATIDYANEKLAGLTLNANYTVNGVAKTADASGTITIETSWFGTTVSIKKTGNGTTTVDSIAQSRPIPARPAAPGVTASQPTEIGGTGSINGTNNGMEYKPAAGSWTAITGSVVTGLTTGSYSVRVKATGSAFKSAEFSVTINAFVPTQEATPTAIIDFASEKLTGLVNGNYTFNGGAAVAVSGPYAIQSGWFGTTVSIVKKGNGTTTLDSAEQSRAIPTRPGAPPVSDGVGMITGASATMEISADGTNWSLYSTPVPAGFYFVRVKQGVSNFVGTLTNTQVQVTADKTALNTAISTANGSLAAIKTGYTEGDETVTAGGLIQTAAASDVPVGLKQIAASDVTTYTNAVAAAQTVASNASATQAAVDSAVTTLATATTAFGSVQASGSKTLADRINAENTVGDHTIILYAGETLAPKTLSTSGVHITLKGNTSERIIKLNGRGVLFRLISGVTLTLADNITLRGLTYGIDGATQDNNAALISVNSGCTLEMKSNAKITENTFVSSTSGGATAGVSVVGGIFTMADTASISGNTINLGSYSTGGGGVAIMSSSTFTMGGSASITDNTATYTGDHQSGSGGGGVYVSNSTFTMRDNARISENTTAITINSDYNNNTGGGGVYVVNSTFTMQDSTSISGNTATTTASSSGGGGVYIYLGSTFTMSDSTTISGNVTNGIISKGGGVYVAVSSTFIKTGGIVYGTEAGNGDLKNIVSSGTNKGVAIYVAKNSSSGASADVHLENTVGTGHNLKVTYNNTATPSQTFYRWNGSTFVPLSYPYNATEWAASTNNWKD
jgi:hypothetical protein